MKKKLIKVLASIEFDVEITEYDGDTDIELLAIISVQENIDALAVCSDDFNYKVLGEVLEVEDD